MKKMLSLLTVVLFTTLVVSCAPTQQQIDNYDYGTYPSDYQDIIKSYMSTILKDPYSAEYDFVTTPTPGHVYGTMGWMVCAYINGKNSYGGYVGYQPNFFIIDRGQVIRYFDGISGEAFCEKYRGY